MTISANTLFHFVSEFQYLKDSLEGKIYPRYCLEYFGFINNKKLKNDKLKFIAMPMICFCDIPLSQVNNHIKQYGNFAIGMSKVWAQKHQITPIHYVSENNSIIKDINTNIKTKKKELKITQNYKITDDSFHQIVYSLVHRISYLKPVKEKRWLNGELTPQQQHFYDEREWRYVPKINKSFCSDKLVFCCKDTFLDNKKKNALNEIAKSKSLGYTEKDIKYVIMPEESISDFKDFIEKSSFFKGDKSLFMSKVITIEQIKEDF